jgi:hypothetical protein
MVAGGCAVYVPCRQPETTNAASTARSAKRAKRNGARWEFSSRLSRAAPRLKNCVMQRAVSLISVHFSV